MKVWIEGKWYDYHTTPIVLKIEKKDKEIINNISPGMDLICYFDENNVDTKKIIKLLERLKNECRNSTSI